jgi:hypothetical protein
MNRHGCRARTMRVLIGLVPLMLAAATASAEDPPLRVRGLFTAVVSNKGEAFESNYFSVGTTPFDPYLLRLFFEGAPTSNFQLFAQIQANDEMGLEIYGAYAMWTPTPETDFHVLAGKIPWIIGTWGPRTYADKNPLIGQPMMWQFHTTLSSSQVPPDADALLSAAGSGQYGVDYGTGRGWRGMPIVYDNCWDAGIAITGSRRPFEFSAAVTNGTPSTGMAAVDANDGKSFMGRIGLAPLPGVRFGVSGSQGPYLSNDAEPSLGGRTAEDFDQILLMADAEWLVGRCEFRAEAYLNTFETATVGDLETTGGYAEARVGLGAAWYVAARGEAMRYSDLQGSAGVRPWNDEYDRYEAGVGWRVARQVTLKAVTQHFVERVPGVPAEAYELYAGQLVVAF